MMAKVTFARALCSEAVRLRRSPLVPLHLALALALGATAGAYFGFTPTWDSLLGTDAFFQLLGAGAPLLVGISCGLSADAEREAGDYAYLLGVPARRAVLAAKGSVLFALGVAAAALAAAVFCGIMAACGRALPDAGAIASAVAGIAAGSASLYVLGLAVALRYGRNAAIGLGAIGCMVAIASLGGLANGLVTGTLVGAFGIGLVAFIPFAWPARLASIAVELPIAVGATGAGAASQVPQLLAALRLVALPCAAATVAPTLVVLAFADRFERVYRSGE